MHLEKNAEAERYSCSLLLIDEKEGASTISRRLQMLATLSPGQQYAEAEQQGLQAQTDRSLLAEAYTGLPRYLDAACVCQHAPTLSLRLAHPPMQVRCLHLLAHRQGNITQAKSSGVQ